jgi:hydrogenase 3 maturation protease
MTWPFYRGDDVAGIRVAQRIEKLAAAKKIHPKLKVFIGETAPENLTGEIKRSRPAHFIIIDAADLGLSPGKIAAMTPGDIGGTSFCTHSLSLKIMSDYLLRSLSCEIIVIGIQPKNL